MFITIASPLSAQEDCRLYDALSRITNNMGIVLEEPNTARMQVNLSQLRSDLYFLDVDRVPKLLHGVLNPEDIANITQQLDAGQLLVQAAASGDSLLQRQIDKPETLPMLTRTRAILSPLICDDTTTNSIASSGVTTPVAGQDKVANIGAFGLLPQINVKASALVLLNVAVLAALIWLGYEAYQWYRKRKRRQAKRYDVNVAVSFATGAINYNGRLCDISLVGGKIAHNGFIAPGTTTPIKVLIDNEWYPSAVVWSNDNFCGVQFDQQLAAPDLKAILSFHRKARRRRTHRLRRATQAGPSSEG